MKYWDSLVKYMRPADSGPPSNKRYWDDIARRPDREAEAQQKTRFGSHWVVDKVRRPNGRPYTTLSSPHGPEMGYVGLWRGRIAPPAVKPTVPAATSPPAFKIAVEGRIAGIVANLTPPPRDLPRPFEWRPLYQFLASQMMTREVLKEARWNHRAWFKAEVCNFPVAARLSAEAEGHQKAGSRSMRRMPIGDDPYAKAVAGTSNADDGSDDGCAPAYGPHRQGALPIAYKEWKERGHTVTSLPDPQIEIVMRSETRGLATRILEKSPGRKRGRPSTRCIHELHCEFCNAAFQTKRDNARFCSRKCYLEFCMSIRAKTKLTALAPHERDQPGVVVEAPPLAPTTAPGTLLNKETHTMSDTNVVEFARARDGPRVLPDLKKPQYVSVPVESIEKIHDLADEILRGLRERDDPVKVS